MSEIYPVVTIDGPSGAGKGTLSQLLAQRLGYRLLDSGALYRLVALSVIKQNVNSDDESSVKQLIGALHIEFDASVSPVAILLNGEDVTSQIRQEAVGMLASKVAAYPGVRAELLVLQRSFATGAGLVADGRDMGTVVFPAAKYKFFLTATAEARAQRRFDQLLKSGVVADKDQLINDILTRDERDSTRSLSPLVPAADALIIDSTSLSIDEVLEMMLTSINKSSL